MDLAKNSLLYCVFGSISFAGLKDFPFSFFSHPSQTPPLNENPGSGTAAWPVRAGAWRGCVVRPISDAPARRRSWWSSGPERRRWGGREADRSRERSSMWSAIRCTTMPSRSSRPGDLQEPSAENGGPEFFVHLRPDDHVGNAGLVLQRQEDHARGRARALAGDHQPADGNVARLARAQRRQPVMRGQMRDMRAQQLHRVGALRSAGWTGNPPPLPAPDAWWAGGHPARRSPRRRWGR